jgi:hypothetical protein
MHLRIARASGIKKTDFALSHYKKVYIKGVKKGREAV